MPPTSQPPLLRELIDIPESTSAMDFVLTLTDGVADPAVTLRDYVITERLVRNFDEALGLIRSAVDSGGSKAAYLHGSFGSGKSHFMAVLHALLHGKRAARERDEFAGLLHKHDGWLSGRKFLLVPYYFFGTAKSMEQQILGGYVDYVRNQYPDAPIPAVHRTEALLDNARATRARVGDAAFIRELPGGSEEDEWGDTEGWTTATLDAAMAAAPDDELRRKLVNDLLSTWFSGFFTNAREDAEGFISLDRGLTEIARHAKEHLGCDALVLFLDELILWLAGSIGNQQFVAHEVQKINNLVEGGDARRPIPIVSFIARQRDIRELVGESVTGAVETSVQDTLNLIRGRFDVITLEDRNLPEIARERLLKPVGDDAKEQIGAAFERITRTRPEVWSTLLGSDGITGSDKDTFRATYPFSPAFMDTLVHASSALQRTRTGLKLMRLLLIDQRDELRLGQLIPLGDLYEVISRGGDRPFTDKLRTEFETAQKLYQTKFRPYLLETHGLTDEDVERARRGAAVSTDDPHDDAGRPLSARVKAFTADDRLVKTLLLSALLPTVPALRNLTAARLSALNYGSFTSPIPRGDVATVTRKLEEWASKFGEIQLSSGDDRIVSLKLIDVDIKSVLDQANSLDTTGARKGLVKRLLWEELKVTETGQLADRQVTDKFDTVWRGSKRSVEVLFGNVRDPEDLVDEVFRPFDEDAWRLIIDYPFDEADYSPADDRQRVEKLRPRLGAVRTVCWIPASLTNELQTDLGQLVKIEGVLGGQQFESYVQERNPADQHRIRQTLESQRDWLRTRVRGVLRQAYGLAQKQAGDVNLGYGGEDHLLTLAQGLKPKLSIGAAMNAALEDLAGQMLLHQYPAHPDLDSDRNGLVVRPVDVKLVLDYVRRANEDPDGRVEVEKNHRVTMRRIANPLKLGEMYEAAFVIERFWVEELYRRAAQEGIDGDLKVSDLLDWLDEPTPRGLERHVANLVISCFAEQTDRVWMLHGGQVNPPPELVDARTRNMVLREQHLPTEEAWKAATERAKQIFGLPHPGPLRGRIVRMFAADVAKKAGEFRNDTHDLVSRLEQHAAQLGIDADATSGRLHTARAASVLLDGLREHTPGGDHSVTVVNRLASADLGGPPERAGTSISSARNVVTALDRGPWSSLGTLSELQGSARDEADAIRRRLRETAQADELTDKLGEALAKVESAATKLVRRALVQPQPIPSGEEVGKPRVTHVGGSTAAVRITATGGGTARPTSGHAEVIGVQELEGVLQELRSTTESHPDATIEISWRVSE